MKLLVHNLGKIRDAEISLDGITVLTGNNDTGKSTVGKSLFGAFYSMRNISKKIEQTKRRLLRRDIENELSKNRRVLLNSGIGQGAKGGNIDSLLDSILESEAGDVRQTVRQFILGDADGREDTGEELAALLADLTADINQVISVSDEEWCHTIVTAYFGSVFHDQVNRLDSPEDGYVQLIIKGKAIKLDFRRDNCINTVQDFDIASRVYYMDNPYVLDYLNRDPMFLHRDLITQTLIDGLKGENRSLEEEAASELLSKRRLENVMALLNQVVPGELDFNKRYVYSSDRFSDGLSVGALSSGLKTFVMLKALLKNDSLKSRDVLVLDEPEVHLHPDWLKLYAEIIVFLQVEYDLTILVTTHSFSFTEALDFYAKKYGLSEKVHYYVCKLDRQREVAVENVDGNIEKIYKRWLEASLSLRKEEYAWEESREPDES